MVRHPSGERQKVVTWASGKASVWRAAEVVTWASGKASVWRAADLGSIPAFRVDAFPGRLKEWHSVGYLFRVDLKNGTPLAIFSGST